MPDLVPPGPAAVFAADRVVLALTAAAIHFRKYTNPADATTASVALLAGDDPRAVFGWGGSRLPVGNVRAVEHVPAANAVVVWRAWWRDPLRVVFGDPTAAEMLFERLAAWAGCGRPERGRVGPHDLPMNVGLGVGVLLAFLGTAVLVLGAVEGAGQVPAGGGRREMTGWAVAAFGEDIGFWPAVAIAACVALSGVGLLARWWRTRPEAWTARPPAR